MITALRRYFGTLSTKQVMASFHQMAKDLEAIQARHDAAINYHSEQIDQVKRYYAEQHHKLHDEERSSRLHIATKMDAAVDEANAAERQLALLNKLFAPDPATSLAAE